MNTFTLTISSAAKIYFSGNAVYCGVTTMKGEIGFEAHHEPFLGVLADNSTVVYKDVSGSEKTAGVKSGMIAFKDNICTITVSE